MVSRPAVSRSARVSRRAISAYVASRVDTISSPLIDHTGRSPRISIPTA
jgi:hypothetical protein